MYEIFFFSETPTFPSNNYTIVQYPRDTSLQANTGLQ